MNVPIIDVVILVSSVSVVVGVLRSRFKNRKKVNCGGGCSGCAFASSCKELRNEHVEKKVD